MVEPQRAEPRYRAFLSYSHKDEAAAGLLHRRLETYRLPRRLVATATPRGAVPERLAPIFRDREELPAATDLTDSVREALAQSGALIVVCSPHAAGSLWVAEEIETFRKLHPHRPILAAVLEGDPPDCFPPVLRAFGQDGTWHEPLATDLRPGRDGAHLGLLKLVAGITGVGLDALVQRDAQRKIRRVTAVTAAALVAMLIMATLTWFALDARREAERQRAEAEGLIEFMLTDLRTRLKSVGRIEIMAAVNGRALEYYARHDFRTLPTGALLRRSRVLHSIGDDNLTLEREAVALAAFREAHRTTAEQLSREPDDPERIFAHSQSEYWIGMVAYRRRDFARARTAWHHYRNLTQRLIVQNPRNSDWMKEAGYAEGNLCTLALAEPIDAPAALEACSAALRRMEQVRRLRGDNPAIFVDLANRHGWMVNAWDVNGRWDRAQFHQAQHESIVRSLLEREPRNLDYRDIWMRAQYGFAERLQRRGEGAEAQRRLVDAAATAALLRAQDPGNADWARWESRIRSRMN